MNSRSLLFVMFLGGLACLGVAVPHVHSQGTPPAVDAAAVLATLKDLKSKQAGLITKEKTGVLSAINAAIADPAKAYEQATAAVSSGSSAEPERAPGGNDTGRGPAGRRRTPETPRERTNELLRDRNFVDAVRLHLTYLALTWQHSMGAKTKDQLGALMGYAAQVESTGELYASYEMLRKPLGESLFVTYFQIGPYLTKSADWEDRPFNADGIYQKTILPELRAQKDPRLIEYWNTHIVGETARASASQNALTVNRFNNVRKPALMWSRAEDELALGQTNQAVADMMVQIKAHPDHPDFDHWVNRVTEIVTPAPKGDPAVGAPATTGLPTAGGQ